MISTLIAAILLPTPPTLAALQERHIAALAIADWPNRVSELTAIERETLDLVTNDQLRGPSDFELAARLLFNQSDFQLAQVGYELTLCAAVGDDASARKALGAKWDGLLVTMSRGRRIGALKMNFPYGGEPYKVKATAKVILAIYANPQQAVKTAEGAKSNPEVKAIVDADQKSREGDFSKFTMKQMEDMGRGDQTRLKRIKAIVAHGDLATAVDFFNAGLVCQHGETFEDYALAHELAVCATLLGSKEGPWLTGASYDRMLSHSGFPQRFATQYSALNGAPVTLSRYDTHWINDTERKLLVHLTLEQAKNRKFD